MAEQNSYDFWTRYSNLCLKCKVCPLKSVIKHMRGTTLCCPVERIRSEHWQFLLSALSVDNSLTEVCFKSDLPSLEDQKELWKRRRRKNNESYPIPYGYSPHNISDICKYSVRLLQVSQTLQALVFENLPITREDAEHLAEGLKSSFIKEFAFRCFPHSDEVIETICRGLWDSKVFLLDFTAINLSLCGLSALCNVIKKQKTRRSVEAFPDTLRSRLPVLEKMLGLSRITLNGNKIGDKGVEMICDTVFDDRWIQALDLQCCGITNNGAMALLKQITTNNSIQAIDLRLNEIEDSFNQQIAMQLSVNSFGKLINYSRLPLWKPRIYSKALPVCRNKLKTKVTKKYSKTHVLKKEAKSLEHAFRISCEIFDGKDASTEDVAVQTMVNSEVLKLKERMRQCELKLLREMTLRNSLIDLLEKFKLENAHFRNMLCKDNSVNQEDVILIDRETYLEIKHVFEKFQRFLQLMKEYRLWGLVSTIGVAEYENTRIKCVPSDSKMSIVKKEHLPSNGPPSNGPVHNNKPVPKQQTRCCSCGKPECISNQKAEKGNDASNKNHIKNVYPNKAQLRNIVDRAKVTFKELRETYTSYEFGKHSAPTVPRVPRKSSAADLTTGVKSMPTLKSKPFQSVSYKDIPDEFKNIKTEQELCDALKRQLEQEYRDHQKRQSTGIVNKRHFKNVSSQTAAVESFSEHESQKNNPAPVSGSVLYGSHKGSNSRSTIKSYDPESNLRQTVNLVSNDWDEYMRKNISGSHIEPRGKAVGAENPSNSFVNDSGYFKLQDLTKTPTCDKEPFKVVSPKSPCDKEPFKVTSRKSPCDKKPFKVAPRNSQSLPKDCSPISQEISNSAGNYVSANGVESKFNQTPSSKGNSNKSYLESVSDASTDKDVESLSASEVYESVQSDSVKSNKINKSSKTQKTGFTNSVVSDNSSKSSKKSQKQKKNSNQINAVGGGKSPKENVSIASVPSLSDITTISSRSLNTDSVMGKLSDSEKGLS